MNLKHFTYLKTLILFFNSLLIYSCNSSAVQPYLDTPYFEFLDCNTYKIEHSYKKHYAFVIRTTGNNNMPPPYNEEFFILDLDPDNTSSLYSYERYVLPNRELPDKFRIDSLAVCVTGEQLSCHYFPKIADIKYAGNTTFDLKEIEIFKP